jgi:hypothetical protein
MYSIAMRTYGRSKTFSERTYKFLKAQTGLDLAEQLYIFVANKEEKALYEEALKDQPYKQIVVGVLGIKEVTDFMFHFFGNGKEVFFFDDDLFDFFEFPGHPLTIKIQKESTNLHNYLLDGFKTIHEEGISTFAFRSMTNPLFISGKAFKEIRPHYLVGSAWGAVTNFELHTTMFGHNEDMERSAKVIEEDGGSLVYNWAGMISHINNVGQGLNEGGMQSSGDRGDFDDPESRYNHTKAIVDTLANKSLMPKYFNGPFYDETLKAWDWKIKPLNSLRKYPIREKRWDEYFDSVSHEIVTNKLPI